MNRYIQNVSLGGLVRVARDGIRKGVILVRNSQGNISRIGTYSFYKDNKYKPGKK